MATLDSFKTPVQMRAPTERTRHLLKSELNRQRLIGQLSGAAGMTALRPTASTTGGTTLLRTGGK